MLNPTHLLAELGHLLIEGLSTTVDVPKGTVLRQTVPRVERKNIRKLKLRQRVEYLFADKDLGHRDERGLGLFPFDGCVLDRLPVSILLQLQHKIEVHVLI